MYQATTDKITVKVEPVYLEEKSAPDESHFVWAYKVTIENHGKEPVRLQSRYWKITDSHGLSHEVTGEGVVGEQPVLYPGEIYQYTSGTPLSAPGGIMFGKYYMVCSDGRKFAVDIPAFSLDSPYHNCVIH